MGSFHWLLLLADNKHSLLIHVLVTEITVSLAGVRPRGLTHSDNVSVLHLKLIPLM